MTTTCIRIEEKINLGEEVRFLLQTFKKKVKALTRKEDIMLEVERTDTVNTYPVRTGSNIIRLKVILCGNKRIEVGSVVIKGFNSFVKEEDVARFLKGLLQEIESWREIEGLYVNSFVNWRRG
ncbi:hypothetical protein [Bacillus thuringiensis]|uniref:hypothetical protein n=1 Tax=Bacillus thuringiensis TaxID=1428 RepID=UPI000BFBC146|nr:hypothetical protein [Bacillus thuringiensis]PGT89880.1 hypothetical protein COD17_09015 [Bacillus thuringiensis]